MHWNINAYALNEESKVNMTSPKCQIKHGVMDYQVGHDLLKVLPVLPVVTLMVDEIDTMIAHLHLRHVYYG